MTVSWALLILAAGQSMTPSHELPRALEGVNVEQRIDHPLPLDVEMRDAAGDTVRLGNAFGETPVILAPVYYECPMLCPTVLQGLTKALRVMDLELGEDYRIVTFSIDPGETAIQAREQKAHYLGRLGGDTPEGGWWFLTGERQSIQALTEAIGFQYTYDAETELFNHAAAVVVATPEGKLFRYFYGIEPSPRDLKWALVEASENKVGSLVDQVLLYCFHYDPRTGRYGVVILNVIRLLGALTVVGIASFILLALWRERRATA